MSESSISEESSQIFCNAPNAPCKMTANLTVLIIMTILKTSCSTSLWIQQQQLKQHYVCIDNRHTDNTSPKFNFQFKHTNSNTLHACIDIHVHQYTDIIISTIILKCHLLIKLYLVTKWLDRWKSTFAFASEFAHLKSTYLAYIVVFGIKISTEILQQSWPVVEPTTSNNCRYENANSGSNQCRWVTNASETFVLDKLGHFMWKFLVMSTNVIL